MNISSTTDGETSFTLKVKTKRRTISAHKTREGRHKERADPSFKVTTNPNCCLNPEKELKLILSERPQMNNNNDQESKSLVIHKEKKKGRVTFAEQMNAVTILPVIVHSPVVISNKEITSPQKKQRSSSVDTNQQPSASFRKNRVNVCPVVKEKTQCKGCIVC